MKGAIDLTCARIESDIWPVIFTVYANGAALLVYQGVISPLSVGDGFRTFRIPRLRPERIWSFQIQGTSTFDLLHVSQSMKELK